MTLSVAAVMMLASTCQSVMPPPGVSFDLLVRRAAAHAIVESHLIPNSIHRNTNGTIDAGIMQVNSVNWSRLDLTPDRLFDLHANICAGMQVIAENYDTERRVSCRYNTGKPDCASNYPDRIAAAMAKLSSHGSSSTSFTQQTEPCPKSDSDGWHVRAVPAHCHDDADGWHVARR